MSIAAHLGEQWTVPLMRPPMVTARALWLITTVTLCRVLLLVVVLVLIGVRLLCSDSCTVTRPVLVRIRPLLMVVCIIDTVDTCRVPSTVGVLRVCRSLTRRAISLASCVDLPATWLVKHCMVLGLLVVLEMALVSSETVFVGAPSLREIPAMKLWCTCLN